MPSPLILDALAGAPVPSLAQVVAAVELLHPPHLAQDWDAVGLVCGDPDQPVRRVLLAVDPVQAVAEEAVAHGADLLLTHHPALLRPVHGVAATTPAGRVVHTLLRAGTALHVAHTNADAAAGGVNDALADVLGMGPARRPLEPAPERPSDLLTVQVPHADAARVLDALAAAGAGRRGDYERAAWSVPGTGTFRPLPGAHPAIGTVGATERVGETRIEVVLDRSRRGAVVAALRAAHPYEEPAFAVLERAALPTAEGIGRVGELTEPVTLAALAARAAAALPSTAPGVRAAGDPERLVRTLAVCGGSGDSLLEAAERSGADAYLTADLRHHRASDALAGGGPALLDTAHWATEWPWLPVAGRRLQAELSARGTTVEVLVSRLVTDPWTVHAQAQA